MRGTSTPRHVCVILLFTGIISGLKGPCRVGDKWPEKEFYYECINSPSGTYWTLIGCFPSWDPMATKMVNFNETADQCASEPGFRLQCTKIAKGAKWEAIACLFTNEKVAVRFNETATINGVLYNCTSSVEGRYSVLPVQEDIPVH